MSKTNNFVSTKKDKSDSDIIAKAADGLGHLCYWSIKGHYKPQELRDNCIAVGLPNYIYIPDRDLRGSINCVNRKFKKKMPDGSPVRAEIVYEDGESMSVGFLSRKVSDTSRSAKWTQFDSINITVYNTYNDKGTTSIATEYIEMLDRELAHYFGNEVRHHVITPIMKQCQAITLHAGLRFVTKKHEGDIIKLQQFMENIGAEFNVLTQLNNKLTKKTLESEAKKTLSKRVTDVQNKLKDWSNRSRIRSDAEENMLAELADIKDQAELMKDALQIKLDGLTKELDDARAEAKMLIENQEPKGKKLDLEVWKNSLDPQYEIVNNDETMYMIPSDDWEKIGLKFSYRAKDGFIRKNSPASKALGEIGFYGYVKSDNLIIRPME